MYYDFITHSFNAELDNSAGIATGYGLGGWGSIPGRGRKFVSIPVSRPALGPTQSSTQWVKGAVFPGVKRPGREADNWPPTSAEVKNGGAVGLFTLRHMP
jgi:hypothetical protein